VLDVVGPLGVSVIGCGVLMLIGPFGVSVIVYDVLMIVGPLGVSMIKGGCCIFAVVWSFGACGVVPFGV
jgi:hypothetical protein